MSYGGGNRKKSILTLVIILALMVAGGTLWYLSARQDPSLTQAPDENAPPLEVPVEDIDNRHLDTDIILPAGMLVITKLRADYQDADMRLVIPRLELDTLVRGDTSQAMLSKGPGLYKYSQIPNTYNTNVSIAGHRDLPPYDFYYLDTVQEGDFIYLIYKGKLFQYAYRSTRDIEPTDWDPIRVYYDSRVTLTTCTPLGTFRKRMVVVGELVAVEDYTEAYVFQ